MIQVIPAIDVIGGKCVRLSQGDFRRVKTYGDPLEMARRFEAHGMKRLHLVDLDGAREKQVVNYRVLEQIASRTSLAIDAGGGIRNEEDLRILFDSGAAMVTLGSLAVKERERFIEWLNRYGPGRILLGADVKQRQIAVSGWEEETSLDLFDFLEEYAREGIRQVICTDIARDGMLEGPSVELYREIGERFETLEITASGGISRIADLEVLEETGTHGVIVGKALYEERIALKEIESFIVNHS